MKDYNDDDRKFFDRAVLAIIPSLTHTHNADALAETAFGLAITLTVKRKAALDNLEDEIFFAQREERKELERQSEEVEKSRNATKPA